MEHDWPAMDRRTFLKGFSGPAPCDEATAGPARAAPQEGEHAPSAFEVDCTATPSDPVPAPGSPDAAG